MAAGGAGGPSETAKRLSTRYLMSCEPRSSSHSVESPLHPSGASPPKGFMIRRTWTGRRLDSGTRPFRADGRSLSPRPRRQGGARYGSVRVHHTNGTRSTRPEKAYVPIWNGNDSSVGATPLPRPYMERTPRTDTALEPPDSVLHCRLLQTSQRHSPVSSSPNKSLSRLALPRTCGTHPYN